jgi:hypothetical protein
MRMLGVVASSATMPLVWAGAGGRGGLGNRGGSSNIDSVIMRDRDEKTGWTAASDGTLEERVFYVQNWRSDVVALVNAAGRGTPRLA